MLPSVRENLAIAHDDIDMRIAMSLDAVDMSGQREADPTRMSGGQQQRVAIAGMLAMNPEILVLDEPTAMLDPQGRADIMHILDELQQHGTTIILVTHHRDEFVNADRIIRLDNGRIVQSARGDTASIPETGRIRHSARRQPNCQIQYCKWRIEANISCTNH